jgi:hypothetical protein
MPGFIGPITGPNDKKAGPRSGLSVSWTEERGRYDRDAILPSVGVGSRRDDDRVQQIATHLVLQPVQVSKVRLGYVPPQLYFQGKYPTICPLENQVNLVAASLGPEMLNFDLRGLSVGPYAEGNQGFEEMPEKSPVTR